MKLDGLETYFSHIRELIGDHAMNEALEKIEADFYKAASRSYEIDECLRIAISERDLEDV